MTHQRQQGPDVRFGANDEERGRVDVRLLGGEHVHPAHAAAGLQGSHPQLVPEGYVAGRRANQRHKKKHGNKYYAARSLSLNKKHPVSTAAV